MPCREGSPRPLALRLLASTPGPHLYRRACSPRPAPAHQNRRAGSRRRVPLLTSELDAFLTILLLLTELTGSPAVGTNHWLEYISARVESPLGISSYILCRAVVHTAVHGSWQSIAVGHQGLAFGRWMSSHLAGRVDWESRRVDLFFGALPALLPAVRTPGVDWESVHTCARQGGVPALPLACKGSASVASVRQTQAGAEGTARQSSLPVGQVWVRCWSRSVCWAEA